MLSGDLQLVRLAIEREAVDWLQRELRLVLLLLLGPNEGELNVRVQVVAHVLEWQLELLDALGLLDSQGHQLRVGSLVEQLLHALDSWVVEETQEQHLHRLGHLLGLQSEATALVVCVLLGLGAGASIVSQVDVDEGHYSRLQSVLRGLHHDDEFLGHLRADLDGDILLQFLGNWVLDEPAVEFDLRVLNEGAILVLEWQLIPVILSEDLVAWEVLLPGDAHGDDLVFFADVAEQES